MERLFAPSICIYLLGPIFVRLLILYQVWVVSMVVILMAIFQALIQKAPFWEAIAFASLIFFILVLAIYVIGLFCYLAEVFSQVTTQFLIRTLNHIVLPQFIVTSSFVIFWAFMVICFYQVQLRQFQKYFLVRPSLQFVSFLILPTFEVSHLFLINSLDWFVFTHCHKQHNRSFMIPS